jgi:hypothetical protein
VQKSSKKAENRDKLPYAPYNSPKWILSASFRRFSAFVTPKVVQMNIITRLKQIFLSPHSKRGTPTLSSDVVTA